MGMREELSLIVEISDILGISATGRKILALLAKSKRKLSVAEIIASTKRSERSVKAHLKALIDLNLVQREISVTKSGRLAYRYFKVQSVDLIFSARRAMLKRLRNLKNRWGETK